MKGETNDDTIIVKEFSTPPQQWVDNPDRKSAREFWK